ncbi:MAG: 50S ribosomal protein L28 [Candidatus Omnitrophica bacterium]|nr:50S ribosomal protein L28 [Candidatus Omnitrophota bacterium]
MLKICAICKKGSQKGRSVVRKGMAKKKGGTGRKTVRTTKREFLPNLQKIRIILNGRKQTAFVCTKCIKKGLIRKA